MSMFSGRSDSSVVLGALLISGFTSGVVVAAESPNLGEPVSAAQVEAASFTIMADGTGLPAGSASAVQGEALYATHCLACHGAGGENGINDRLVGGHDSITSGAPVKTVGSYWPHATTLFDYIRRAMPYQTPGTLTDDEVYALTAYILFLNGIVAKDAPVNADTLPEVRMPNRDNFAWAVPGG